MRIALVAVGSRGDVEPYLAFGRQLQARGHEVRLAALAPFEAEAVAAGLAFHSLGELPQRFKPREAGAAPRRDASTLFRGLPGRVLFWSFFPGLLRGSLDRFITACEGMDAVVFTRLALPVPHVAEKLGILCFAGFPVPHAPTDAFENPLYVQGPTRPGHPRNRRTYAVEWGLTHQLSYRLLARFRRERLGLRPVGRHQLRGHLDEVVRGSLYGYSEHVLPRPGDWPAHVQATGYWQAPVDPGYQPPAEVQAFLAEGDAPIFVGFGSMKAADPRGMGAVVRALGRRAIVQRGWGNLEADGRHVLVTDALPHGWLFPRVAAVVHHGGAGTTGASLTAGVPTVIVPHAFDQAFWGRRVHELGCGPAPIQKLSVASLEAALHEALARREATAALGERLRAEDGALRAAELLERWLGR